MQGICRLKNINLFKAINFNLKMSEDLEERIRKKTARLEALRGGVIILPDGRKVLRFTPEESDYLKSIQRDPERDKKHEPRIYQLTS